MIGTPRKKNGGQFPNIDNRLHIPFQYGLLQKKQHYSIVLQRNNDEEQTPQEKKTGEVEDKTGEAAAWFDIIAGVMAMTQELYSHCKQEKRYYIPDNAELIIGKCNGGFVDGQQQDEGKRINNCTATLDLSYIELQNSDFQEEGGWHYFFRAYGLPLLQTFAGGASAISYFAKTDAGASIASSIASMRYIAGNLIGIGGTIKSLWGKWTKSPETETTSSSPMELALEQQAEEEEEEEEAEEAEEEETSYVIMPYNKPAELADFRKLIYAIAHRISVGKLYYPEELQQFSRQNEDSQV